MPVRRTLESTLHLVNEGWRMLVAHPSLLAVNLTVVFLPVLLVQLAAPAYMRGRTSPIPGGAFFGALFVLLLIAGSCRVAATRARRVTAHHGALSRSRGEVLLLITAALLGVLLGQSLLSGVAEVIGLVRPGPPGSDAAFTLDYPRYVVITMLAYAWTVSVLTLLVVCSTLGYDGPRVDAPRSKWPWRARGRILRRGDCDGRSRTEGGAACRQVMPDVFST